MSQRAFTSDDQLAFAKLSGDYNPLHMDPILARRLLFGRQVVHGLHVLLWGVDHYFKNRTQPLELQTVRANFQAGIGLGQTVNCRLITQDEHRVEIQLEADKAPAVWIQIAWSPLRQHRTDNLPTTPQKPEKCRERSIDEAAVASGNVPLYFDGKLAAQLFPNLMRVLPANTTSRSIGDDETRRHGMPRASLHLCGARSDIFCRQNRSSEAELSCRAMQ